MYLLVNDYLKINDPHITMLFCFSDGCARQYKNHKNFINLCHHLDDIGADVEGILFVTSDGKSPCDGIGGLVKRHVAKRSLQQPLNNQNLIYEAMIDHVLKRSKHTFHTDKSRENVIFSS